MPKPKALNGLPKQSRQRPLLRNATLVLPSGERVKGNTTFGPPSPLHGSERGELSPLLGNIQITPKEDNTRMGKAQRYVKQKGKDAWTFANSKIGRGVFKCSIAYLLGSMATFIPWIYHSLGRSGGKHVVATITVYYHPARSIGSAFEALICSMVAWLYVVAISFSSMGISILFGKKLGIIEVGHVIVLIVFCGGGLGFVGWVKQRYSHAVVNISCSLAALALITVLTKEGAVQAARFSFEKISQELKMVLMGIAFSTITSVALFPVSARKDLRSDMVLVTDLFGDVLTVITRAFLTGSDEELQSQAYADSFASYKKVFASMTKNLKEAKREHYVFGSEKEYHLESKMVKCMQRLAQNIGGLRSAATTQFILLAQPAVVAQQSYESSKRVKKRASSFFSFDGIRSPVHTNTNLESVDETPEIRSIETSEPAEMDSRLLSDDDASSLPPIRSPSDIFTRFIMQLGPSMKSLAITMKRTLDEVPFDREGRFATDAHYISSLRGAIALYNQSRREALEQLYKSKEVTQSNSVEMEADFEEVAASCGYFSFSLQNFANEMITYLEILDDLRLEVEERPEGRTWAWLRFWRPAEDSRPPGAEFGQVHPISPGANYVNGGLPDPPRRKYSIGDHLRTKSRIEQYRYRLWRTLSFLRRDDVKFAVKVGTGAALYALPSFLSATRPFYRRWRGEWGLLSYILVCTMTLGASNTTGWSRFVGTVIGALCAIVSWEVADRNVYLLAFFGWLMCLWCSYIVIGKGHGPFGRFIVLTYNLSALYAYSVAVHDAPGDPDEGGIDPVITEITLHRTVAVISGCIWGLIITRMIFPISDSAKFKDGLSLLWLRMGLIWKRDPLNMLLEGASPDPYMDLREEFDLHRFLTRLESLRGSAQAEIHLRGPFPEAVYGKILKSTGAMLDAFHALNVMISKNPKASKGEAELLKYTEEERTALCVRLSHLFQVLASSMKLEFPMNNALPSVGHTRDRLLAKMFRFRREEKDKVGATDEDFELLYAFALVTGQLSEEVKGMGKEIEKLFGAFNEDLLKLQ